MKTCGLENQGEQIRFSPRGKTAKGKEGGLKHDKRTGQYRRMTSVPYRTCESREREGESKEKTGHQGCRGGFATCAGSLTKVETIQRKTRPAAMKRGKQVSLSTVGPPGGRAERLKGKNRWRKKGGGNHQKDQTISR